MCGICGLVGVGELPPESRSLVAGMCRHLAHRGPDDEGIYAARRAVLGATRLQVVDLAGGHQPMANEDETVWVAFNGEIYNHLELRRDLEARGHRFRTRSDTEAIVHAWEEYGTDCPRKLAGMFAFALWDTKSRCLFAARDRFGQKPFYYARQGDVLSFASELGALATLPGIGKEIDEVALHHYLSLQYVPDPLSIYRDVRKLPAAHWLSFADGRLEIQRYWELAFEPKTDLDENETAEELERLLRRAVRRRLMSDVPLGAFLSGGVDSSVIVALMAEESAEQVRTFSIGFDFESLDELPFARAVAERWNTEHHEFVVTPDRFEDLLPAVAAAFDEPFADASSLQTWHLARETRRHVTVALNGDGGDELFAGYTRYWLDRWVRPYTLLPGLVTQRLVPAVVGWLPEPEQVAIEANWVLGAKRLRQVARVSPKASILRWGSFFDEEAKARLYRPELTARLGDVDSAAMLAADFDRAQARSFLDRTQAVDIGNYLCGDILVKADRMTMAHSLEGRSPFLDHELAEFAARLPGRLKLRRRTGKWILRRAFSGLLPPAVRRRGKRGFGAPLETWLRRELRPAVEELLLAPEAEIGRFFRREPVARMIEHHRQRRADHSRRIWSLLVLEAWLRQPTGIGPG